MKQAVFLVAMISCFLFQSGAQEIPQSVLEAMENQLMETEEEQENDQLLQQLDHYLHHPLNINTAQEEDLIQFGLMSALQIQNLLQYRRIMGEFIDIHELQAVPSFDPGTIRRIKPFVVVKSGNNLPQLLANARKGQHTVLLRSSGILQARKGFLDSTYLGDRNYYLLRYRFQYKNLWYAGVTAEKDAGERFALPRGFDFYSFHFFIRNWRSVKSLALGDYLINLGQGLVQWQGMGFGKSGDIMNIKRQGPVLQPYRSAGEFNFNRGGAIHIGRKKWEAAVFISFRKMDASGSQDSLAFSSLQSSGYHRSRSELNNRNRVQLVSMGGMLGWRQENWKWNLNLMHHQFSLPQLRNPEPYLLHAVEGRSSFNYSLDGHYTYRNLHFFGEYARNLQNGNGLLGGMMLSLDPRVDISLLYRKLDPAYQSQFGNAFMESSTPSNENGLYWGLQLRPFHGLSLDLYADHFKFPWLRYRISRGTEGFDYFCQLVWNPDRKTQLSLRFRTEKKDRDLDLEKIVFPESLKKTNLRISWSKELGKEIVLRTRVEINQVEVKEEIQHGFLWYWEFNRKYKTFKINGRVQYFETDGYDARVYAYEQDVLYGARIPAFYGRGIRYFINIQLNPGKKLACWIRISESKALDKKGFGSGADRIEQNRRTEIRIQFLYSTGG